MQAAGPTVRRRSAARAGTRQQARRQHASPGAKEKHASRGNATGSPAPLRGDKGFPGRPSHAGCAAYASVMSLIFATQLTAVATAGLAAFAIVIAWYARRAFLKQS